MIKNLFERVDPVTKVLEVSVEELCALLAYQYQVPRINFDKWNWDDINLKLIRKKKDEPARETNREKSEV